MLKPAAFDSKQWYRSSFSQHSLHYVPHEGVEGRELLEDIDAGFCAGVSCGGMKGGYKQNAFHPQSRHNNAIVI